MPDKQFFIGRQPILGREGELVAYELLFRGNHKNAATIVNDVTASAAVIQAAFLDLGIASALGGKKGFINVSEPLLMSDTLEMLPRDHVVLEILETVPLTAEVVARCRRLREIGYVLALDDIVALTPAHNAVLPFISVVKLDVLAMQPEQITAAVSALRRFETTLLAEKIETLEHYHFCRDLGFDLFQGYFFAHPAILTGKTVQPTDVSLIKLLGLITSDAETGALEDALKQTPALTLRLLKLANSAAYGLPRKISSVRQAIVNLGRNKLSRLVQIMMFAKHGQASVESDPLVQTAAIRGYLMERLATELGWNSRTGQAFMTGMLSLAGALFGCPLGDVLEPLDLEEDVKTALLTRGGAMGTLLRLVEASERAAFEEAEALIQNFAPLTLTQFNRLHIEALQWAETL